ncbi:MAG: GAF domain-containing protein [Myxococcales bacterium]|nr:GAF domain-containing protein [Myxococcales bacterium]
MSENKKKSMSGPFTMEGQYQPGSTTDFITDAFMRIAALYDDFGTDIEGALQYVSQLLRKSIQLTGGGLLLTDINDPNAELKMRHAFGPMHEELSHLHLPLGRGALGYCAEESVALNVADCRNDARAEGEALLDILGAVGPLLCAPVIFQERLEGVLYIYRNEEGLPFSAGEMNIVNYFSRALAEYIGMSRGEDL